MFWEECQAAVAIGTAASAGCRGLMVRVEGPGELLMENPIDWLKLRQAREEADIE